MPDDAFQKMTFCLDIVNSDCAELNGLKFLFCFDSEELTQLENLSENYQHFVSGLLTSGNMDYLGKFIDSVDVLLENIVTKVEKQISI